MTADEFEDRVQAYVTQLGARDRRVLLVAIPGIFGSLLVLGALAAVFPQGTVRPFFPLWVGTVAVIGIWVLASGWAFRRATGPGVPCPTCRRGLAVEADRVLATGSCPYCGASVIDRAT